MGVVLDKIQFVLVIITFTEIMWPYLQLNSDTTQESNILNQSSLITFQKRKKKHPNASDGSGMHLSMC